MRRSGKASRTDKKVFKMHKKIFEKTREGIKNEIRDVVIMMGKVECKV